ncbi:hypothetical protein IG631_11808 [Alternaria alternata]|nr:hypothetical protein IG631_11808 [Alternaria alternata]
MATSDTQHPLDEVCLECPRVSTHSIDPVKVYHRLTPSSSPPSLESIVRFKAPHGYLVVARMGSSHSWQPKQLPL